MKHIRTFLLSMVVLTAGCQQKEQIKKESWINKPVQQWPDFALTNEVVFADTTFKDLANAFLLNTGSDTIAASCKHIFMVFDGLHGIHSIDPGDRFKYWRLYPKNKPNQSIKLKRLINRNSDEPIGRFNTLKNRDWIIFDVDGGVNGLYPLKIRYSPIKRGEVVYAVGWGTLQKNNAHPARAKYQCFQHRGNYYYAKCLTKTIKPNGRSGSPVIDKNGYLVGITSGAEGKLTVIGSVQYLKELFDRHKVEYTMPRN